MVADKSAKSDWSSSLPFPGGRQTSPTFELSLALADNLRIEKSNKNNNKTKNKFLIWKSY